MEIKMYTIPSCPHSEEAKKFLKSRKIKFEEISLFKDKKARLEMIELTGQLAVPVIKIDEEVIIGFDETTLNNILKKKKNQIAKLLSS